MSGILFKSSNALLKIRSIVLVKFFGYDEYAKSSSFDALYKSNVNNGLVANGL